MFQHEFNMSFNTGVKLQFSHQVLVKHGLPLTATQRKDGGGRHGAEMPQREGGASTAQLRERERSNSLSVSCRLNLSNSTTLADVYVALWVNSVSQS